MCTMIAHWTCRWLTGMENKRRKKKGGKYKRTQTNRSS